MKWTIIVNPTAGSGKAEKYWRQQLAPILEEKEIGFQVYFTQSAGHGSELAVRSIESGSRHIAAIGGDGTFQEVVNGIMHQDFVPSTELFFAPIPMGTGNDWVRSLGISTDVKSTIERLKNGKIFLQDVGSITYHDTIGGEKQRYFMNVAGAGFDAFVAKRMGTAPKWLGKGSYFWELLKGLFSFQNVPIRLRSDSFQIDTSIFVLNVGIGRYLGSGMKVVPNAILDDGLFDITFVEKASKWEIMGQLKGLYDGSFIEYHKVKSFQTKSMVVESSEEELLYLQADGELLGQAPLRFEILPKKLKILQ